MGKEQTDWRVAMQFALLTDFRDTYTQMPNGGDWSWSWRVRLCKLHGNKSVYYDRIGPPQIEDEL